MQFVSNGFNILKVWFKSDNWKYVIKIVNSIQYKCAVFIITCVLIDYGKCKMQLLNNGFSMLKVDNSIHVSCW